VGKTISRLTKLKNALRYIGGWATLLWVCLSVWPTVSLARRPPAAHPQNQPQPQGQLPPEPGRAPASEAPPPSAAGGETKSPNKPEDEDFSGTPFTEYGEFNQADDEEEDAKFFQFGRFFGVSLGLGLQFVDGNRGALWQGGFPVVDFKLHYWFNFNIAVDMGFRTSQQYFDTTVLQQGHVDINMLWVGVDVKYYFETRNLSAPISFANPYILLGAGAYNKTQVSNSQQTNDQDSSLGVSAGAGLEFVLRPRKIYVELEGKIHIVTFKDTYTTVYQTNPGLSNLTGNFFTSTASFLFTW
jgi:hypothetical protein